MIWIHGYGYFVRCRRGRQRYLMRRLVQGVEEFLGFVVAFVVFVLDFVFGAFEGFFGGDAV